MQTQAIQVDVSDQVALRLSLWQHISPKLASIECAEILCDVLSILRVVSSSLIASIAVAVILSGTVGLKGNFPSPLFFLGITTFSLFLE